MVIVILWGRIVKKYSALIGPKSAQNPSQIHTGFCRIFYWIVFKQFCPKNPPFSVISSKISIFVILCDFTEFLPKQEIDLF